MWCWFANARPLGNGATDGGRVRGGQSRVTQAVTRTAGWVSWVKWARRENANLGIFGTVSET